MSAAPQGKRMLRNVTLIAAALAVTIALAGCASNSQQADQAEAAAQRAQESASRAEEAAAEALQASQQAAEASERAEKSVEDATREINAVADRMERRALAHKAHKKKIASAHGTAAKEPVVAAGDSGTSGAPSKVTGAAPPAPAPAASAAVH
jgi:hypothetical protein